jgi:hypothetical protein
MFRRLADASMGGVRRMSFMCVSSCALLIKGINVFSQTTAPVLFLRTPRTRLADGKLGCVQPLARPSATQLLVARSPQPSVVLTQRLNPT